MIVPTPVPFSTLSAGAVYTTDNTVYSMVVGATNAVNLATGGINNAVDPTSLVTPLPGARLVLG